MCTYFGCLALSEVALAEFPLLVVVVKELAFMTLRIELRLSVGEGGGSALARV